MARASLRARGSPKTATSTRAIALATSARKLLGEAPPPPVSGRGKLVGDADGSGVLPGVSVGAGVRSGVSVGSGVLPGVSVGSGVLPGVSVGSGVGSETHTHLAGRSSVGAESQNQNTAG